MECGGAAIAHEGFIAERPVGDWTSQDGPGLSILDWGVTTEASAHALQPRAEEPIHGLTKWWIDTTEAALEAHPDPAPSQ